METELTKTSFIDTEIQKFENKITKESLIALVDSVKDLASNVILQDEKSRLKEVEAARKLLKGKRVEIQKESKNLRESAVRFQKAVISKENELIEYLYPTEVLLQQREDDYYAEKERLRLEEEKKESDRIQAMIEQLNEVDYAVDFHELKALTDEQFQDILTEAKEKYAEKQRLEVTERQKQKDEERRQAELKQQEEERLLNLRKEQEERERLFKIEQDKIKADNDRIRKEQEAKELELKKRQDEIDRQERERVAAVKAEQEKKEAEERARIETEERIKREIKEKAEREQQEKEEAAEKLKFGEDSDRFAFLAQQIEVQLLQSSVWSHMKSKKGKHAAYEVHSHLKEAFETCNKYKSNRKAVPVSGIKVDD